MENVLSAHPAVQEVGVVGVLNAETTNLTRAYVVLRQGYRACAETAEDIKAHVATRLLPHLHLHGGVRFLHSLPQSRGGKLDRLKLREIAMEMPDVEESSPEVRDLGVHDPPVVEIGRASCRERV